MNLEIQIVLAILAAAVGLFLTNRLGPDLVSLLTVPALFLTGRLQVTEALAGFGNPAVITIASICLVTAGLTNTGIAASCFAAPRRCHHIACVAALCICPPQEHRRCDGARAKL